MRGRFHPFLLLLCAPLLSIQGCRANGGDEVKAVTAAPQAEEESTPSCPKSEILCDARSSNHPDRALVVVAWETELNSAPPPDGRGVGVKLMKGAFYEIQDEKEGWLKVYLRNGKEGWVPPWDVRMGYGQSAASASTGRPPVEGPFPVWVRTLPDMATVRSVPTESLPARADHARLGYALKGVRFMAESWEDGYFKIQLDGESDGYIQDESVGPAPPKPLPGTILSISRLDRPAENILSLRISEPPFATCRFDEREGRYRIALHHTGSAILLGDANRLVEGSPWRFWFRKNLVEITYGPTGGDVRLESFDRDYTDGSLRLRFRRPPVLKEGEKPLSGLNVFLDPGHGSATQPPGFREGARGLYGLKEEEINLELATALKERLERRGATVGLSRTKPDDSTNNLYRRLDVARESNADLFLSLHANADPSGKRKGSEIYWFDPSSEPLARRIFESLSRQPAVRSAAPEFASFAVLRYAGMPAVLIEAGYLTHDEDAHKLMNPVFHETFAEAVVRGVEEYRRDFDLPAPVPK